MSQRFRGRNIRQATCAAACRDCRGFFSKGAVSPPPPPRRPLTFFYRSKRWSLEHFGLDSPNSTLTFPDVPQPRTSTANEHMRDRPVPRSCSLSLRLISFQPQICILQLEHFPTRHSIKELTCTLSSILFFHPHLFTVMLFQSSANSFQ